MKQIFILALFLPTLCTTTHAQWRYLDVLNNEEVTCLAVSGGSVYAGTLYGSRRAQVNDLVHSNDNQYAATRKAYTSAPITVRIGRMKYVPVVALAVTGSGLYAATKRKSIWHLPLLK